MNLDDETLLTAYLDDELDAARRLEVEAALRAHPHLEQRLSDLKLVRDLVASLPRPSAPADLSARILNQIDRRNGPRRLGGLLPSHPTLLAALSGLAAAAVLLVAVVLTFPNSPHQKSATHPASTVGPLATTAEPGPRDQDKSASNSVTTSKRAFAPAPTAPAPVSAPVGAVGGSRRAERGGIGGRPEPSFSPKDAESEPLAEAGPAPEPKGAAGRRLGPFSKNRGLRGELTDAIQDEPARQDAAKPKSEIRRIVVGLESLDPWTVSQVRRLVAEAGPEDQHLKIAHQYTVPPQEPGKAVVFALVLSGQERKTLLQDLEKNYPGRIHEDRLAPVRLKADLSSVSQFEELSSSRAAPELQLGLPTDEVKRLFARQIQENEQRQHQGPPPPSGPAPKANSIARAAPGQRLPTESVAGASSSSEYSAPANPANQPASTAAARSNFGQPGPPASVAQPSTPPLDLPQEEAAGLQEAATEPTAEAPMPASRPDQLTTSPERDGNEPERLGQKDRSATRLPPGESRGMAMSGADTSRPSRTPKSENRRAGGSEGLEKAKTAQGGDEAARAGEEEEAETVLIWLITSPSPPSPPRAASPPGTP